MRLFANVKAAAFASVAAIGLLSAGGASAGDYAYAGYHGLPPGHPTAGHWASSGATFGGHGHHWAPGTLGHAYYHGGPYHRRAGYYGGGVYYAPTGGYGGGDYRRSAYSAADVYVPYYVEPVYERTYVVPTTVYQPVVRTSYVPVTTYRPVQQVYYAPTTYYSAVRQQCRTETLY